MRKRAAWYWRRFRAMSAGEVLVRLTLAKRKRNWRNRIWVAPEARVFSKDPWCFPNMSHWAEQECNALLAETDLYLLGNYNFLNVPFRETDTNWRKDPQTGIISPLVFGPGLDYRDAGLVGNVKNVWEKNRHHHLTVIALAYALKKDERYSEAVKAQLYSWAEQNPFPLGVNWISPMEMAIRLISWVWIERLLRGSSAHTELFGEKSLLWPLIFWHQWMISKYYSHGSSANNHLVGEMAGLFISSSVWPFFKQSTEWQVLSSRILEREINRQTFPSGLNREQSFSYHVFSLEFFLLAGVEGKRLGLPFSSAYGDILKKMLEVMPVLVDAGGNMPRYGDGDGGMALQLRPLKSSRLDWLYRVGRSWLNAALPCNGTGSGCLAAVLIWPGAQEGAREERQPELRPGLFEDAGIYVLSSKRGTLDEVFCLVNAGPLGYLSIAAHGHANALSFTLSVGGTPVIVDPGTYTYHYDPVWREYFRGTKAHNTVVLDQADQSVPGGPFMWIKKAETKILNYIYSPAGGLLEVKHDGYLRLPDQVLHQRKFTLNGKKLEICDTLSGRGKHHLEWRLHFAPDVKVSLEKYLCQASWYGGRVKIILDRDMLWSVARGEKSAGWYSPGFNLIGPTNTLVGSVYRKLPVTINSSLEVENEN